MTHFAGAPWIDRVPGALHTDLVDDDAIETEVEGDALSAPEQGVRHDNEDFRKMDAPVPQAVINWFQK